MLDHDYCIRACGERSAGHDFAADSRFDGNCGPKSGTRFANYAKDGRDLRNVFNANSKPIADRFIKWGRIGVAEDIFAENARRRLLERESIRLPSSRRGPSLLRRT